MRKTSVLLLAEVFLSASGALAQRTAAASGGF